ncbi:MAG: RsmB/NOP family class I SAM-dependent RNA methyltransferase [Bacteroidota bacterium]
MSSSPHPFTRYRDLIDDWAAFDAAIRRPLPTCVWINPLRAQAEMLEAWWHRAGVQAAPLPGCPGAYRLDDPKPGTRMPYWAGAYHVQEQVSMLPPLVLQAQPHERVLDACAAPGNKTAQLAVALGNTGLVVANDWRAMRLKGLRGTMDRLGLVNVAVTVGDAARLPDPGWSFDRVLADVPCSCEGTTRKNPALLYEPAQEGPRQIVGVQEAILRRSLRLCRPGGRVVYATCTYAPEENEAVVEAALRAFEGHVRTVPVVLPGVEASPGLTAWRGRTFDASLTHTRRVWPHHRDTGGFFVAVLEKEEGAP